MKKMKIMKINYDLKFDTLYVFILKRNCCFQVFAKNVSFRIKTNQFGLAMYCRNANNICKTHEYELNRNGYAFIIITKYCKSVSINTFDNIMQDRIKSFLLLNIKKANANRTTVVANTNLSITTSKSVVSTLAQDDSKNKANNMKLDFASQIAFYLDDTKNRLIDLLNNNRVSYKEFDKIFSKILNKICSFVTLHMHYVNVNMKKSIIKLLNQSNITSATA